eukprot:Gregarina_sp_Poly_1__5452@NODE_2880_length_1595_cov_4_616492_g1820_i0_p3_GENE_NODE_2880_length_1595_cov_4_616492_g1820_i0NODE_2880_length_1595_cov_4_616492_g1820_i0_p3_ORF_typecomplete_len113_score3_84Ribosomal_L32e/PF01655_18/5_2Ribosomal_L32e/PF01655_18/3_4cEGF/PF12662_7/3_3cEGF/PF12662_7/25SRC1/PF08832_10/66SRC1/PF08832_10/9_3_NODE_2880_length_1595_cov_4_616492_g1820_i0373711
MQRNPRALHSSLKRRLRLLHRRCHPGFQSPLKLKLRLNQFRRNLWPRCQNSQMYRKDSLMQRNPRALQSSLKQRSRLLHRKCHQGFQSPLKLRLRLNQFRRNLWLMGQNKRM